MQVQPPFHSIYSSFRSNVIQRLAVGCMNSQPPGTEFRKRNPKAIFLQITGHAMAYLYSDFFWIKPALMRASTPPKHILSMTRILIIMK